MKRIKINFYKNFWFWIACFLLIYLLKYSDLFGVNQLFDIIIYIYKQMIKEPIAFFAFIVSVVAINLETINVIKSDRRSRLSISYKIEEKQKVKA